MSKEGVKFTSAPTIEVRRKSIVWPIVGVCVSVAVLLWAVDHLQGNCLELQDALTYCPIK